MARAGLNQLARLHTSSSWKPAMYSSVPVAFRRKRVGVRRWTAGGSFFEVSESLSICEGKEPVVAAAADADQPGVVGVE